MNRLPCPAELADMLVNGALGDRQFAPPKPVVLPKLGWAPRTAKIEHRFPVWSDDMNMRWTMVGGINHDPQPPVS